MKIKVSGPCRLMTMAIAIWAATSGAATAGSPPSGARLWDGNDPFHQPVATTDYQGSGDVDLDGTLTAADAKLAEDMADGLEPPSPRADVDSDGDVDRDDLSRLHDALDGAVLGGWWDRLPDRAAREQRVARMMALDKTDEHPWAYWFQCHGFSIQTHLNAAFYRGDLGGTRYNGGATLFNVPMYYVSVPSAGHSINAVLVGEDPLLFDDWLFVEPQSDEVVHPGMWNMPFHSEIKILLPSRIQGGGFSFDGFQVEFYVDPNGGTLTGYNPDLVLVRSQATVPPPGNRRDLWNPRIVPGSSGRLLVERQRQDASAATDLHLAHLGARKDPFESLRPLVGSERYSRLLDVAAAPDGKVHLLWTGEEDYVPSVFHGRLSRRGEIVGARRISTGSRMVHAARMVVTPAGELHAFWLERKTNSNHPYGSGVYWTRKVGNSWQPAQNLTPRGGSLRDYSGWSRRDELRHHFDAEVAADGAIVLIWAEPVAGTDQTDVTARRYDAEWSGPQAVLATAKVRGLDLLRAGDGPLHLVYWVGDGRFFDAGRGDLMHATSIDGFLWSSAETIDAGGGASSPRMARGAGGKVHLVWEREIDDRAMPLTSHFSAGVWSAPRPIEIPENTDAWYPTVERLDGGEIVAAWSSRSTDRVEVGLVLLDAGN